MVAAILFAQGLTFAREGDSLGTGRGYAALRAVNGDDAVWAGVLLGLAVLVALQMFFHTIPFRLLVTGTAALLLLTLGVTFYLASPLGLGHTAYGVPGLWMAGHFVTLARRFWRIRRATGDANGR